MFLYSENKDENIKKNREDILLWESFCCGDRQALNDLFRMYYTPLFDYGIKIVANKNDVKDAIQKLFFKLWKTHDSLSTPDSVKAYLLVSLRRILLRSIKKKRNRYERNKEYMDDFFSITFSKEELIIHRELEEEKKALLVQAINHLNDRQKETLFLRYYHGLSNQEIAEVIDINQQSVKNNLYRALKSLRGIIQSIPNLM